MTETAIYTGSVVIDWGVNVRSGPGLTYLAISSLPTGSKVNIVELRTVAGNMWVRLQRDTEQWVAQNYGGQELVHITVIGSTPGNPNYADKVEILWQEHLKGKVA